MIDQIILVGDYAKGNDSGLIEVFLIGQGLNMEYIAQLEDKIEDRSYFLNEKNPPFSALHFFSCLSMFEAS